VWDSNCSTEKLALRDLKNKLLIDIAFGPESLTMAMAPIPGGVESAHMVSFLVYEV
jgi:hypothetical protein